MKYVGLEKLLYDSDYPLTLDLVIKKLAEIMTAKMKKIGMKRRGKQYGLGMLEDC